jgi:CRISPR/Cas system CSM-associated protein Csm5 (group 7 of RAMP superfamily)
MGNYCKTCDQRFSENQNEIIRQSGDLSQAINKRNNIKENFLSKTQNKDILNFVPEIIFLQRKIKKFISSKKESNQ